MKKKLLFLSVAIIATVAASAAEKVYYQIYRVEPFTEGTKIENGRVFYEDANCKISYNFGDKNGDAGFTFTNKTDKFITLDLAKTFFVKNGYSYSYFLNRVTSNSSSGNIVTTDSKQAELAGVANALLLATDIASASMGGNVYSRNTISAPQTVTTKSQSISYYEQPTITIPAKCKVWISEYCIAENVWWDCETDLFPKKKEVKTVTYTRENSPFWFGNIITYRVDDGADIIVKNHFYVKSITNTLFDLVREYTNKSTTCPGKYATQSRYLFTETYIDGFYVKYTSEIKLY